MTVAAPKHAVGQTIIYEDYQGRLQKGEVLRIEAHWYNTGDPLIIYTVYHPTYRNNRHYAGEDRVKGSE